MPAKSVQFGSFALSSTNGVYIRRCQEMHGAKRVLTILDQAQTRGVKVLGALLKGKVITVEGIIKKSNESDFILAAQNFVEGMMAEYGGIPTGDLTITNSVGTYVYDDCVLLNPDDLMGQEQHYNITWIPFKATFLCPKGFARSSTQSSSTTNDITTSPYSGSVVITGDAIPEPLISVEFDTPSTITAFTFTNTTTNESISLSGLTIVAGDIFYIDIENKEVRQNTVVKDYTGIFPTFLPGTNNWQLAVAGTSNIDQSQLSYDGEQAVYGNNWVSQEFQVSGSITLSQVALYLKKIAVAASSLYDNFNDNSINSSLWGTSGRVSETGGMMVLTAEEGGDSTDATLSTSGKVAVGITGFILDMGWDGNRGNDSDMYIELTDGTNKIRFSFTKTPDKTHLVLAGSYGSGEVAVWDGHGNLEIRPNGSTIEIYGGGSLRYTLTDTVEASSYINVLAGANRTSGGETIKMTIDNVYTYTAASANTDLTVRIETDSSGKPSGTLADADGTMTIAAADVSDTTFTEIIKAFAGTVSLSGSTVYHLVIKQTGGDTNNYYLVRKYSAGAYANGEMETTVDGGTNWTNVSGTDLYFKLYSALPASFNIDVIIYWFASFFNAV